MSIILMQHTVEVGTVHILYAMHTYTCIIKAICTGNPQQRTPRSSILITQSYIMIMIMIFLQQ